MAETPRTPHSRQSSRYSADFDPDASPTRRFISHSYRTSTNLSQISPISPRFSRADDELGDTSAQGGGDNGLGNLADELADADEWEGEDEYEEGDTIEDGTSPVKRRLSSTRDVLARPIQSLRIDDGSGTHDSGIDVSSASSPPAFDEQGAPELSRRLDVDAIHLSPVQKQRSTRHRRNQSEYDGSDYGEGSDLEETPLISAALETKMAAIEGLARRGLETNGGAEDGIVERVVDQLRDLGSQTGVENGAMRLATAHAAISTHIAHQTRAVTTLTAPLVSPLAPIPSEDVLDSLLPLLASCIGALADLNTDVNQDTSQRSSLYAIHNLSRSTSDLVSTLSHVSDALHMSRHTTTTATRVLRTVREAMAEWKRESEAREEGVRWIEKGGWDLRLESREAGRACEKVVGGFEEVCDRWRERLVAQAAAAG